MLYDVIVMVVGLALVAKGGDLFVDSSLQISRALHVPRMVIGGTLVSVATTVPELTVSVTASILEDSGIALGNAVGSAIANIGLIVGAVALVTRVTVDREDFKRRWWWMSGSAVLVVLFSWNLEINRISAGILFSVSLAYLYWDYRRIRRGQRQMPGQDPGEHRRDSGFRRSLLRFIAGAVLVIAGSRLLVTSGIALAEGLGISSFIIGLSIVAVGTSVPELVTGIASAIKGVPDLSIGNIVGANLLNLALIVGLSGTIHPLTLTRFVQWYSYPWLAIFILVIAFMLGRKGVLGKRGGVLLLLLYASYVAGLVLYPLMTQS